MWQTLAEFSDERIENLYSDKDFEPMKRLIFKLRKREYANEIFAYTSLYTFCMTLQSEYTYEKITDSIDIRYSPDLKGFSVAYNDINFGERNSYFCKRKDIFNLLDAFVLRLFLTRENKPIRYDKEKNPSFEIGEEVTTTTHSYNQTCRTGKIYKIEKHSKQNRFMYFLEENGKRLKKRYFKEHLKSKN